MEIRVDTVRVATAIQDKCSFYSNGQDSLEVYLIVALVVRCAHVKGKASSSHLKEPLYLPDIVILDSKPTTYVRCCRLPTLVISLPWR